MDTVIEFFKNNGDWIFSGIGTAIVTGIIGFLIGRKSGYSQAMKMKVGNNSHAIQAGGDITAGTSISVGDSKNG